MSPSNNVCGGLNFLYASNWGASGLYREVVGSSTLGKKTRLRDLHIGGLEVERPNLADSCNTRYFLSQKTMVFS